ncbi:Hypothetical predicted protein [Octopus vulgaris]|uniref:Uncharacterized protein n=1 Tax=Octopus vulgaris TaxID=6645 RepID=A0AA36AKT2_OCTVU|nr:Hypothetical predicted protein [Octopus vulgaris]
MENSDHKSHFAVQILQELDSYPAEVKSLEMLQNETSLEHEETPHAMVIHVHGILLIVSVSYVNPKMK